MRKIANLLSVFLLVLISGALMFWSMDPFQEVEINKVATREDKFQDQKRNSVKKATSTQSTQKVNKIRFPIILNNDGCHLTNFKLSDECFNNPSNDHPIDLVGQ